MIKLGFVGPGMWGIGFIAYFIINLVFLILHSDSNNIYLRDNSVSDIDNSVSDIDDSVSDIENSVPVKNSEGWMGRYRVKVAKCESGRRNRAKFALYFARSQPNAQRSRRVNTTLRHFLPTANSLLDASIPALATPLPSLIPTPLFPYPPSTNPAATGIKVVSVVHLTLFNFKHDCKANV